MESFIQLIGVLLIFVIVLALTYFTTKWIASYQQGHTQNKNLKVVETLKLTPNKYLQIIEAGDVYLVIGIGKEEITFLTQLTKEQLSEEYFQDLKTTDGTGQDGSNQSFHEILKNFKEHLPKK